MGYKIEVFPTCQANQETLHVITKPCYKSEQIKVVICPDEAREKTYSFDSVEEGLKFFMEEGLHFFYHEENYWGILALTVFKCDCKVSVTRR